MGLNIIWVTECQGPIEYALWKTEVGNLLLTYQGEVMLASDWVTETNLPQPLSSPNLLKTLEHYWHAPSTSVDLHCLRQGSSYRQKVWTELCNIPFGSTLTYAALARKLDSSARAVGNACRDNPFPLLVPCHRVIAANGLGGYCGDTTGSYMHIKRQLLSYESQLS